MDDVSLVSAATVPLEIVWRAFVDGFSGYVVPVSLSLDQFQRMIGDEGISLAASVVAVRRGVESYGVALLAIRGVESWCGGLGVTPSARRHGLGGRLMVAILDAARSRGVNLMRLECIDGNQAAWLLYEGLGFLPIRRLEIFRGAAIPPFDAWDEARSWSLSDPWRVWNNFGAYHPMRPAWQADLAALRRVHATRLSGAAIGDVKRPASYVLVRDLGDLLRIVDSGSIDTERAREHLAMLVAELVLANPRRGLTAHNLAEKNPLNAVLRDAGVPVVLGQTELELRL